MRYDTSVVRLPSTVAVTLPEASKALDAAWQRRRAELGNWQPSNGWLVDQLPIVRTAHGLKDKR